MILDKAIGRICRIRSMVTDATDFADCAAFERGMEYANSAAEMAQCAYRDFTATADCLRESRNAGIDAHAVWVDFATEMAELECAARGIYADCESYLGNRG